MFTIRWWAGYKQHSVFVRACDLQFDGNLSINVDSSYIVCQVTCKLATLLFFKIFESLKDPKTNNKVYRMALNPYGKVDQTYEKFIKTQLILLYSKRKENDVKTA